MADEEINEGEETPEGSEESSVLKLQRARADAAEAKLAVLEKEKEDVETAAQQLRSNTLEEIVNALEIPNLKEDLLRWIEGPVTEESVDAALQAKGLNFVDRGGDPPGERNATARGNSDASANRSCF